MQTCESLEEARREVARLEVTAAQLKQQQSTLAKPLQRKRALLSVRISVLAVMLMFSVTLNVVLTYHGIQVFGPDVFKEASSGPS